MDTIQLSATADISEPPLDQWTIGGQLTQSQLKRFDPLEVLPEEIWIAIIVESARVTRFLAGIIISQDALLNLMKVSRLWNIRISSSPMLWVDIILEDEYDAASKAYLALHYSKRAPIALHMYSPAGWWDTLQEQIMANRGRITKLFIEVHIHHSQAFSTPILRQLSPLPLLTSLRNSVFYDPTCKDNFSYLSDSPLEWVDLWMNRSTLEGRAARELRRIYLDCELNDVFDLLEGSESLQEVVVQSGAPIWHDKLPRSVRDPPLQGPPLPWRSLMYRSDRDSFLVAIIGRLPNLVNLRIHVSQNTFCYLMPLVCLLENLSIFGVTMRGKWDPFERLVIPQTSTSVRETDITINSDISLAMDSVLDALFWCLANTSHLTLNVTDLPTIFMLTSSKGFQKLHSLVINTDCMWVGPWSSLDAVLEPLPISTERVTYWADGARLKQLIPTRCHHIKYLEIYSGSLSEIDLDSRCWTAIRTIHLWHTTTLDLKGPTYQNLHTICLMCFIQGQPIRTGTKICHDIALHPEYFPVLRKLEFEDCPELDILFILLETRNVSIRPGICPIATLVIPTRCPPYLVERLRGLINGTGHGVSDYYSLSIAGNYDIITDSSITGCADCHTALRFCGQGLYKPGARFSELLIAYPESVTEILESWDSRAEQWYPVEATLRYRQCGKKFPPVSITH